MPRRGGVTRFEKMFRGEVQSVWEGRLIDWGWPQPMAGLIAAWAVGSGPLPHWPPYGDHAISAASHRAMAAYHTRLAELLESSDDQGKTW